LVSHPLQCSVVRRGLGRMQDAVEPVCARPGVVRDPLLECAPASGQDQAADLTVCWAC
jgi:hypothetical protein